MWQSMAENVRTVFRLMHPAQQDSPAQLRGWHSVSLPHISGLNLSFGYTLKGGGMIYPSRLFAILESDFY
jgi:hypothetical protein